MAHNKLNDLRDHMFAAMERLSDENLTPEKLEQEIEKAKAISAVGSVVINSAKIEIDYLKATGQIDTQSELFKSVTSQRQINQ